MFRSSSIVIASSLLAMLATGSAVPAQDDPQPQIIMVSGPLFDPFFSALKKGADDAAAHLGITYQYSTVQDVNNVQADMARVVDQAVAVEPDALVVGNFFPDAQNPMIERAAAQDIPVIIQDGGYASWQENGAVSYVGYNPEEVGLQAGAFHRENGVENALCVNHVPGNPTLEAACTAFLGVIEEADGKGRVLTIALQDAQNPQANLQAIRGALEADPTIDGIMTLGGTQATLAAQAAQEAGFARGEIIIGGSGLTTQVLENVRDGSVAFAIDLQPYLSGYYGLLLAYHKVVYDLLPAEPVIIGPRFVFADDAQAILDLNTQYTGIRGIN